VEVAELWQWILEEHCRLIALLGMGGIGKSTLASLLGSRLAKEFEAVLWRSVRDAPSCEELVADCITFFSQTPPCVKAGIRLDRPRSPAAPVARALLVG
jgi:ABC-type transport system involved in cytochrome bd biosynthesis fused ATPase/permease subunit